MNKLFLQKLTLGLLLTSGIAFNASAQQPTLENTVTQFVVAQGQVALQELTVQLKQTIADEINQFSVTEALIWAAEENTQLVNEQSKTEKKTKTTVKAKAKTQSTNTSAE